MPYCLPMLDAVYVLPLRFPPHSVSTRSFSRRPLGPAIASAPGAWSAAHVFTPTQVVISPLDRSTIKVVTPQPDGTEAVSTYSISNLDAFRGSLDCTLVEENTCRLQLVASHSSGFTGLMDVDPNYVSALLLGQLDANTTSSAFWTTQSRSNAVPRAYRNADDAASSYWGILGPMVCLLLGEGLLFDVSSGHYPVYVKDSLLNSNPDFDYGQFRELASAMKAGTDIKVFGFTFTEAGTYVFADSSNTDLQMIVTIMREHEQCPSASQIIPSTTSAATSLGVVRNSDIILAPDWPLIIGLLMALLALVCALIGGMYYFRKRGWSRTDQSAVFYRALGKSYDFGMLASKGSSTTKTKKFRGHIDAGTAVAGAGAGTATSSGAAPAVTAAPGGGAPNPAADDPYFDYATQIDLENFNVHTFYDKLDDQKRHILAMLDQNKQELQELYGKITLELKGLLDGRVSQLAAGAARSGGGVDGATAAAVQAKKAAEAANAVSVFLGEKAARQNYATRQKSSAARAGASGADAIAQLKSAICSPSSEAVAALQEQIAALRSTVTGMATMHQQEAERRRDQEVQLTGPLGADVAHQVTGADAAVIAAENAFVSGEQGFADTLQRFLGRLVDAMHEFELKSQAIEGQAAAGLQAPEDATRQLTEHFLGELRQLDGAFEEEAAGLLKRLERQRTDLEAERAKVRRGVRRTTPLAGFFSSSFLARSLSGPSHPARIPLLYCAVLGKWGGTLPPVERGAHISVWSTPRDRPLCRSLPLSSSSLPFSVPPPYLLSLSLPGGRQPVGGPEAARGARPGGGPRRPACRRRPQRHRRRDRAGPAGDRAPPRRRLLWRWRRSRWAALLHDPVRRGCGGRRWCRSACDRPAHDHAHSAASSGATCT